MMLQRHRWFSVPAIAGLLGLVAMPLGAAVVDSHEKEMTAEVIAVDVEAGTLTVEQMDAEIHEMTKSDEYSAEKRDVKGKKITLVVDTDTRITEDGGRLIPLAELEPGERVNITYTMKGEEARVIGVDRSAR